MEEILMAAAAEVVVIPENLVAVSQEAKENQKKTKTELVTDLEQEILQLVAP